MSQYEWTAEEREVVALRKVVKTGEQFEASDAIGEQLVAQGLAKPLAPAAPSKPAPQKAVGDPAED